MRVAHVISGITKAAGPSAFCVRASDFLAQIGVEVDLHVGVLAKDSLLPQDTRVSVSEFGKTFRPARLPELIHVHALWGMSSHRAVVFAKKNKVPYVFSAHGMLAPWALRHKWLKKRIAWWLYQKRDLAGAAMFHATAECEVKWLRDLGFKQPCVVAPLGSDLPELMNAEAQRRRDVKTVLFVGRIYPVKGLMNLVRAWARVRSSKVLKCESSKVGRSEDGGGSSKILKCESAKVGRSEDRGRRTEDGIESSSFILHPSSFPPWRLVIAGPDQAGHKAELVAEAVRLGLTVADVTTNELTNSRTNALPPDIVFTGPVYGEEKDSLYRLADLFVLPSFTENFGVVVTDALAFGVPVITTKGTPWQELLGSPASSKVLTCESAKVERKTVASDDSVTQQEHFRTLELSNFRTSRCGWWVEIGAEPLAEALGEAMGLTDAERRQMGMNGRRLVESKYTWPAVAAELKRAYERVLSHRSASVRVKSCT